MRCLLPLPVSRTVLVSSSRSWRSQATSSDTRHPVAYRNSRISAVAHAHVGRGGYSVDDAPDLLDGQGLGKPGRPCGRGDRRSRIVIRIKPSATRTTGGRHGSDASLRAIEDTARSASLRRSQVCSHRVGRVGPVPSESSVSRYWTRSRPYAAAVFAETSPRSARSEARNSWPWSGSSTMCSRRGSPRSSSHP